MGIQEMSDFNHKTFDWKKAIWDIAQRLAKVEERVNNELAHQHRFTKWVLVILAGVIVGLTTTFFRLYFLGR